MAEEQHQQQHSDRPLGREKGWIENADDNVEPPCIPSIAHVVLELPPSCIEFSPAGPLQDYFVVGTYHLESSDDGKVHEGEEKCDEPAATKQIRSGSLILFRLQGGGSEFYTNGHEARSLRQTIPTHFAVLDLHFSTFEPHVFAIATSSGCVGFYSLESDYERNITMRSLSSMQVADTSLLVLSLAWSPLLARPSTLAVSLSSGQVKILDYKASNDTLITIQSQSLEAWTVAWSIMGCKDETYNLYSGGDDSTFCKHSEVGLNSILGKDAESDEVHQPTSCDVKTHGAGVTAILPVVTGIAGEEILLTGSYDEVLRILTPVGTGKRSNVLAEKRLGGGVWRLKLLSTDQSIGNGELELKVLASCMHAGARVVGIRRSKQQEWTVRTLACFGEHESMNYASDARMELSKDGLESTMCVSTSFYDRRLCIWKIKADSLGDS
ncbi:hypothetical protein MMC07_001384 [Pseudocyphellaria aurata]|nr:hypothetical protein [Pseudocyphellaria aurata]